MEDRAVKRTPGLVAVMLIGACSNPQSTPGPSPQPQAPLTVTPGRSTSDSSAVGLIPPGYGSLKQEDISIVLQSNGVRVAAIPLDEAVIRVLAPDSYRVLRATLDSKRQQIAQRASVRGIREPRVWQVSFTGLVPDARFVPTDITVTSGGRDYRPFDVIALTPGFAEQRVQPRDIQRCLLLFDDAVDMSQPVVVAIGSERNSDWEGILQHIETERTFIRARSAGRP